MVRIEYGVGNQWYGNACNTTNRMQPGLRLGWISIYVVMPSPTPTLNSNRMTEQLLHEMNHHIRNSTANRIRSVETFIGEVCAQSLDLHLRSSDSDSLSCIVSDPYSRLSNIGLPRLPVTAAHHTCPILPCSTYLAYFLPLWQCLLAAWNALLYLQWPE